MNDVTLYHYWRSSSSWRVRWALELKGIKASLVPVNLLTDENESKEHRARNPMGYVPVLRVGSRHLIESMAIIEWLDESISDPKLFPGDSFDRQHVRALCELINAGTQPLHNLSVMEHHSSVPEQQKAWSQHFVRKGLSAYEQLAAPRAGKFSFGGKVSAADLFLVPLCYAAGRFGVAVDTEFPRLAAWNREALATPECEASHPERYKP